MQSCMEILSLGTCSTAGPQRARKLCGFPLCSVECSRNVSSY